jgi:hypothetical protein
MPLVQDLVNEWSSLSTARLQWEVYWRNIAAYVLPSTQQFDGMLNGNVNAAITSVVSTPVAANKSKDLYDMTSLWGIERLTAGMISLKTPETSFWHDNKLDSLFGEEQSHDEDVAMEKLRNYQFKVRSNPHSGFWPAHRAAVKSMCGFGDGFLYIKELHGKGPSLPYEYQYVPIIECYPGVAANGQMDRMFRAFRWSAAQIVKEFGADKFDGPSGTKILNYANDPKLRHETFLVLHGVMPRSDTDQNGKLGTRGAAFGSYYCLPDEKHLIGEGGFFEFPFTRYAWANSGQSPFSEGPVAYAIGEIKSLQEMAKNELLATSAVLRPPMATAGRNFVKLNFNAGANNPGLINGDGRPLFAPMNTGIRPDFAQAVMEARRNSLREMLYLNLWQIILQDKNDTATEALIRAQEKGEMLGPVGISLNEGLSSMVDREVSILNRKGAFESGSPLELPDSANKRNVAPSFTSPLDRLRRMGELVGMQRLIEFAGGLAFEDPQRIATIAARFDVDEMLENAQDILGAPVKSLRSRDDTNEERGAGEQQSQMLTALTALKGGGEAAKAAGEGAGALAGGAEAMNAAPALSKMVQAAPQISQAVQTQLPSQ